MSKKRARSELPLAEHDSTKLIEDTLAAIDKANPEMSVRLNSLSMWNTVLKIMTKASPQSVFFQFTKDGLTMIASSSSSNTCISHWNKDMFHVYKITEEFAFTVTSKELGDFQKTIPTSGGELIISTLGHGEMADDAQAFIMTVISRLGPDYPAEIVAHRLSVGDAAEFVMPKNIELYNSSPLEVSVSADLFSGTITKLCRGHTVDKLVIRINQSVMYFETYSEAKTKPDAVSQHQIQSQASYRGVFLPETVMNAAKKGINTHVHLKWIQDKEKQSSVLTLTYDLSPREHEINSHISFYIAEKIEVD